ncbi:hypothetical protein C8Q74DRAFT_244713 [Fomes fomentarius]|nr:hypothetical protein C8Q74DRAFT_244713 [Fomes fomentarius]
MFNVILPARRRWTWRSGWMEGSRGSGSWGMLEARELENRITGSNQRGSRKPEASQAHHLPAWLLSFRPRTTNHEPRTTNHEPRTTNKSTTTHRSPLWLR